MCSIACYLCVIRNVRLLDGWQGCLALPYAVANCGLVLGIVLVLMSACMQLFSLHILSICAARVAAQQKEEGGGHLQHQHPPSFYSVCQASVPRLTFLVDLAVSIQSFGVCTSYLIVISDLMPDVMVLLLKEDSQRL